MPAYVSKFKALIPSAKRRTKSPTLTTSIASAALVIGALALANYAVARLTERRHPPRGKFVEIDRMRLHFLEKALANPSSCCTAMA